MFKVSCMATMSSLVLSAIGMVNAQKPSGYPEKIFLESNGLVVVEAEHYHSQTETQVRAWYLVDESNPNNPKPNPSTNHSATASGKAYMKILPDTRVTHSDKLIKAMPGNIPSDANFSDFPGLMANLHYKVNFTKAGRYYVWARAYSTGPEDNGVHVGINGTFPKSGERLQWCTGKDSWYWNSAQRTDANHCGEDGKIWLDVPSAGIHTITFTLREDGFEMDRWLMTTEAKFARPAGVGPAESKTEATTRLLPNKSIHPILRSGPSQAYTVNGALIPRNEMKGTGSRASSLYLIRTPGGTELKTTVAE